MIIGRREELVWGDVKEFSIRNNEFIVLGMIGEHDSWETGDP